MQRLYQIVKYLVFDMSSRLEQAVVFLRQKGHVAASQHERVPMHHQGTDEHEPQWSSVVEQLQSVDQRLHELNRHFGTLSQFEGDVQHMSEGMGDVRQSIEALQKQISRAGREQLKANSLTESQTERLSQALDVLRDADERREKELLAMYEQKREAEQQSRLEVIQSLLPVVDGLDEAIRSGRQLLEQFEQDVQSLVQVEVEVEAVPHEEPRSTGGFFAWFREGRSRREVSSQPISPSVEDVQRVISHYRDLCMSQSNALSSWLEGLTFVVKRLMRVFAECGVSPIEAVDHTFDPQQHVAMDVVPAHDNMPEGVVAAELRRGYFVGNRILRHAEVVVAREVQQEPDGDYRDVGFEDTEPDMQNWIGSEQLQVGNRGEK